MCEKVIIIISLSRLEARYLDASSSNLLSSRHQIPRPVLHVNPDYHLAGRSTVLPLCVSAISNTVEGGRGVNWLGNTVGAMAHLTGNVGSYHRAHLEPLNRQERQDSQDWVVSSRAGTWPPRWQVEKKV